MHIAILDCDILYDHLKARYVSYVAMFEEAFRRAETRFSRRPESPVVFHRFSAIDRVLPEQPEAFDGVLIMGSKHAAYDNALWIDELKHFIRQCVDRKVRLAGICFGHQVVHSALGGRVEKSEKGWGVGVHRYPLKTPAMDGDHLRPFQGRQALSLIASHQDQVVKMAEGFTVLAGSDFCPHALCVFEDRIITCQPHPEFTTAYASALLAVRRHCIGPEKADAAEVSLALPTDSDVVMASLAALFDQGQSAGCSTPISSS